MDNTVAPRGAAANARLEVSNSELRTVRDAMRELNRMVEALDSGHARKFVLTHRNQMRAVVLSVEEFAALQPGGGRRPVSP